jgi:predicted MPP superfamily phosphohydrolase
VNPLIPSLIFLFFDAYLSTSLLGTFLAFESAAFSILFVFVQILIASQLWLFFIFFQSKAEQDLRFEKILLKVAFYIMGLLSFLIVFTILRDAIAVTLVPFGKASWVYGLVASLSIIGASLTCFIVGAFIARFQVISPRVEISIPQLASDLQGFKIVQLSDIHLGTGPGTAQVAEMVNRALTLDPDLIVLTGDIIDGNIGDIRDELRELARLKARHGVYFILGNHECYWNWRDSVEAMKKIGITPLLNEGLSLPIAGSSLYIAGINDPTAAHMGGKGPEIPNPPMNSNFNLALIHQPQFANAVAKVSPAYHLQLSGHTHAGQFFPWNWVVKRMYPIPKGLGKIENMWVYVNQGTGYWGPPIRLGTRGEVTQLILTQ